MPHIVRTGEETIFLSHFHRFGEDVEYKGTVMSAEYIAKLTPSECRSMKNVPAERILALAKDTKDLGIEITTLFAKKLAKAEHKGKAELFLKRYMEAGFTKCPKKGSKETEDKFKALFEKEKRFKGRTPRILPQIAAAYDYYTLSPTVLVRDFSIQYVQMLLGMGISKIETVLLYANLSEKQLSNLQGKLYIAQMTAVLLDKAYKKENRKLLDAALWIADHADSELKLLEKVFDKAEDLLLNEHTTVDAVRVQFGRQKALNEVAKIEKAYKKCKFKLKNCVCELPKTTVISGRYKAEILEGDDPVQVMLGYDTDCCQHLGEAGESAMMHGLLHSKAGFWVVTKRDSGKVVAQAEVWELDRDTLVFDNIEFANDAEIDQYKEVIGQWVLASPYRNVVMGCGYNEFDNGTFEAAGDVVPPVTPYELYVLSYEDECDAREEICELSSEEEARKLMERGEITYFDYVYCDSERESVYLKKDGRMAEFFRDIVSRDASESTAEQRCNDVNENEENDYEQEM